MRKTKTLTTFDTSQNIVEEKEVVVLTKVPKYHFKKGRFFLMNKELTKLLLQKNYSGLDYRVLFALLNRIDFNNRIRTFRQADLAEELGSVQPKISGTLRKLETDEIIEKREHDYYFTDTFVKYAGDK